MFEIFRFLQNSKKLIVMGSISILLVCITAFITPILPILLFATASILLILKDFRFGTLIIIILSFTILAGQGLFESLHLFLLVTIITLFSFILSWLRGNISIRIPKEFSILLAIFGIWAFLSGIIAMDHKFWYQSIEWMLRSFIIFFLVYNSFSTKEEIEVVFKIIVLSVFLSTFVSFFVFLGGFSISLKNILPLFTERFAGTIFDPNYFAMTVAASMPLAIVLTIKSERLLVKLFWTFAVLFLIFSMIISQSRTGLFSIAIIFVYSVIYMIQKRRKEVLFLIVPVITVILMLPAVFWYRISLFLQAMLAGTRGDVSMYQRLSLLQAASDVFIKNSIFGVGLGNFEVVAARYTQYPMVCHNTYLEIAANLGLVGLIPFLGILYMGFTTLKGALSNTHLSDLAWAVRAGLLGLYVSILFLSVPFKLDLWVFLALAGVLSCMNEQQHV